MDAYDILKPLASGSFGQIFVVEHKAEGRQYVLKKISVTSLDSKEREGVEQEVTLLLSLKHPNIVQYKDNFFSKSTDGEHLCILMEFCDSGDLYSHLQQKIKKCESTVIDWFIQITASIHFLHQRSILHRDLKTQNIFLTGLNKGIPGSKPGDVAIKLGDFGIAKVLDSTIALAKTQIGTPFYMSPEVFKNAQYSYKSDIWGIGCVLYELVCGKHAFAAQSLNGLALKVLRGKYIPIPPTTKCSKELATLIKSLLSVNPVHRPSIQEILHLPIIRRRIKPAVQSVLRVSPPEQKGEFLALYGDQMCSLGLGTLLDRPKNDVNGRLKGKAESDMAEIKSRLDRLRQERAKQEATLRQLEETKRQLNLQLGKEDDNDESDYSDESDETESDFYYEDEIGMPMQGGMPGPGMQGGMQNPQQGMMQGNPQGINPNMHGNQQQGRNYVGPQPQFRDERERAVFVKQLAKEEARLRYEQELRDIHNQNAQEREMAQRRHVAHKYDSSYEVQGAVGPTGANTMGMMPGHGGMQQMHQMNNGMPNQMQGGIQGNMQGGMRQGGPGMPNYQGNMQQQMNPYYQQQQMNPALQQQRHDQMMQQQQMQNQMQMGQNQIGQQVNQQMQQNISPNLQPQMYGQQYQQGVQNQQGMMHGQNKQNMQGYNQQKGYNHQGNANIQQNQHQQGNIFPSGNPQKQQDMSTPVKDIRNMEADAPRYLELMKQFGHIKMENIAQPFSSCKPLVQNSPPGTITGFRQTDQHPISPTFSSEEDGSPYGGRMGGGPRSPNNMGGNSQFVETLYNSPLPLAGGGGAALRGGSSPSTAIPSSIPNNSNNCGGGAGDGENWRNGPPRPMSKSARSRDIDNIHWQIEACVNAINKSHMTIETLQYRLREHKSQANDGFATNMENTIGAGQGAGAIQATNSPPMNQQSQHGIRQSSMPIVQQDPQQNQVKRSSFNAKPKPSREKIKFLKSRKESLWKTCLAELGEKPFQKMLSQFKELPREKFMAKQKEQHRGFVFIIEQITHMEKQLLSC